MVLFRLKALYSGQHGPGGLNKQLLFNLRVGNYSEQLLNQKDLETQAFIYDCYLTNLAKRTNNYITGAFTWRLALAYPHVSHCICREKSHFYLWLNK